MVRDSTADTAVLSSATARAFPSLVSASSASFFFIILLFFWAADHPSAVSLSLSFITINSNQLAHRNRQTSGSALDGLRRSLNPAAVVSLVLSRTTPAGSRWIPTAERERGDDRNPSSVPCRPRPQDGRRSICEWSACLQQLKPASLPSPPPPPHNNLTRMDAHNTHMTANLAVGDRPCRFIFAGQSANSYFADTQTERRSHPWFPYFSMKTAQTLLQLRAAVSIASANRGTFF